MTLTPTTSPPIYSAGWGWAEHSVGIVSLGDVSHHLALASLAARLDNITPLYGFWVLPPITILPEPTLPSSRGGNYSPQFDPQVLFTILDGHPDRKRVDFIIGIIDSEIHDEVFSTIDGANTAILVSLRGPTLADILLKSGRTPKNYVGLEVSAQLLCLQYRRHVGLTTTPSICERPWHVQRLNCLFDWYGISPVNVTKLIEPKLSDLAMQYFAEAGLPERYVYESLNMAKLVTRLDLPTMFRRLAPDPFLAMVTGALLGWASSLAASQTSMLAQIMFLGLSLIIIGWRVFILLFDKARL